MKFARGRKAPEEFPNAQCRRCNKIYRGPHAGTNPGRQVTYQDENGTYADEAEAQAAGLDTSQKNTPGFSLAHNFTHGTCPECEEPAHAEWEQQLREYAEQRALAGAHEVEPPEGEE